MYICMYVCWRFFFFISPPMLPDRHRETSTVEVYNRCHVCCGGGVLHSAFFSHAPPTFLLSLSRPQDCCCVGSSDHVCTCISEAKLRNAVMGCPGGISSLRGERQKKIKPTCTATVAASLLNRRPSLFLKEHVAGPSGRAQVVVVRPARQKKRTQKQRHTTHAHQVGELERKVRREDKQVISRHELKNSALPT